MGRSNAEMAAKDMRQVGGGIFWYMQNDGKVASQKSNIGLVKPLRSLERRLWDFLMLFPLI